ncbi:glycosyltransferase family 4 protein [Marinicrinis lubricantis]|uniref:Glycosyltransferase family 4 protein n=1 Tax=Marinicrinis lubricantis TaxID=2086470 RepID=A0ABW1IQ78_9BACL
MRVALFTDTYLPDVNGVAKTLGRWVEFLNSKGISCKVFAPSHEMTDMAIDQNIVERFHSIPFLLYPEVRLGIPNPLHIKKTLKELNPTIIHVATPFNMGLMGHRYAKKHNIPLVASYHTHFDQYLSYYKIPWIENIYWRYITWFHQDCEKIYVPSHSTKEYLEKRDFKHLEIWSRGIDTHQFQPEVDKEDVLGRYDIPTDKFVILFVGRLAPEKGIHVLFETFNRLSPEIRKKSHLVLVGDGPLHKDLVDEYSGVEDISLLGFMKGKELSELFAAADVFLFPSATETFGNVVLESMASGTPVVGAAAGGVKDNILHQKTGLLCEPENVDEFTEAVELLFRNPQMREQMSKDARAYSLEQTWESIFERLLASYESVTKSKSNSVDVLDIHAN